MLQHPRYHAARAAKAKARKALADWIASLAGCILWLVVDFWRAQVGGNVITLDRMEKKLDAVGENTLDLQKRLLVPGQPPSVRDPCGMGQPIGEAIAEIKADLRRLGNNLAALASLVGQEKKFTARLPSKKGKHGA